MRYAVLKDKQVIPTNDVKEWARSFEETGDRIVKQEKLKNGLFISTVFIGMNTIPEQTNPLWFESMVFSHGPDKDGILGTDMDVVRTHTWKEAETAHEKLKKKWEVYRG